MKISRTSTVISDMVADIVSNVSALEQDFEGNLPAMYNAILAAKDKVAKKLGELQAETWYRAETLKLSKKNFYNKAVIVVPTSGMADELSTYLLAHKVEVSYRVKSFNDFAVPCKKTRRGEYLCFPFYDVAHKESYEFILEQFKDSVQEECVAYVHTGAGGLQTVPFSQWLSMLEMGIPFVPRTDLEAVQTSAQWNPRGFSKDQKVFILNKAASSEHYIESGTTWFYQHVKDTKTVLKHDIQQKTGKGVRTRAITLIDDRIRPLTSCIVPRIVMTDSRAVADELLRRCYQVILIVK